MISQVYDLTCEIFSLGNQRSYHLIDKKSSFLLVFPKNHYIWKVISTMINAQSILFVIKRLNLIVALFTMTISSCDNKLSTPIDEQDTPIQFSQTTTKSDGFGRNSLKANQTIGTLGYYLQSEGSNEAKWSNMATPNFMYDQKMTALDNGQLTYSPLKYWPSNPNDKIKFFAYSPHSTEANGAIIPSSATAQGYPILSYTSSTDISKQIDLLIAVTAPLNSSPVSLNFKHALTQVSFSAKYINNLLSQVVTITGITLNGVVYKADCTFTDTGFQWANTSITQEYNLTGINAAIPIGDTFADLTGSLYLIPLPESSTTPKLSLELTIGEGLTKKTIERDLTGDWSAGKDTNYQLTIDVSNLLLN